MKAGEGLRKVTVYLNDKDQTIECHEQNDHKDDLVATVQAGMYVIGDKVKVVETSNGYFRDNPGKNMNVIAGPEKAIMFERVLYGVHNILKVEIEMDEIGYDIGLIKLGKS